MNKILLRRAAIEAVPIVVLIAAFSVFCAAHYGFFGAQAFIYHATLVLLGFTAVQLFRLSILCALPGRKAATVFSSALYVFFVFLLAAYYGAVLIGLKQWGRVVSAALIESYLIEMPALLRVLGISQWAVVLALALILIPLIVWLSKRSDGFVNEKHRGRKHLTNLLVSLALLTACALKIAHGAMTDYPQWAKHGEPISLTFFPYAAETGLQNSAVDLQRAKAIDDQEDRVRSKYEKSTGRPTRNLILIVVDALRSDHMGVYGYAKDTTPFLNSLVKTGSLSIFPAARASCAESACGLTSLATSKFVHQFSQRPITLQETLKRNGYGIHMILGGDHMNFYGLTKIYGQVDSFYDGSMSTKYFKNDDQLIIDELSGFPESSSQPIMFQFHLMSAHGLGTKHHKVFEPSSTYVMKIGGSVPTPEEPEEKYSNFYDNGVRGADNKIQKILDLLGNKGYLQNALVVITADHGEGLGEHGHFVHSNTVHEETLKIPLLFISYGRPAPEPHSVDVMPAQPDIAPTILADLGLLIPDSWKGFALQHSTPKEKIYFQQNAEIGFIDRNEQDSIKYWINTSNGKQYVYAIKKDPEERTNLVDLIDPAKILSWRLSVMAIARSH